MNFKKFQESLKVGSFLYDEFNIYQFRGFKKCNVKIHDDICNNCKGKITIKVYNKMFGVCLRFNYMDFFITDEFITKEEFSI